MPYRNRVLPTGDIVAHPARGLFMGNRGRLHDDTKEVGPNRWQRLAWITCLLAYQDRRRTVMGAGYTELFFLDEAVALAAGHRPCGECRREAYEQFHQGWIKTFGRRLRAPALDQQMQADRIDPVTGTPQRHQAELDHLPDGSFIIGPGDGRPCLVLGATLRPFTPEGYEAPLLRPAQAAVLVLTPRCTVAVLKAGYRPQLHPSAGGTA